MTRRQSQKNSKPLETAEMKETEAAKPANVEIEVSDEPLKAPEAPSPEKLQTDFREKLSKREDSENPFIPSTPASLEKAASEVAKEKGFDLNRGTSIGARLLARARSKG